ncbi:MAG: hypothetical protein K2G04_05315, partial [Oscillospiraceae bacterium]|nr:hypothetical protein [Oscillospiraceae bacterium]
MINTDKSIKKFAVIDTETTWQDKVMSIGIVIADLETFELADKKYYILTPFKSHGGMYSNALYAGGIKPDMECSRNDAVTDMICFLENYSVADIYAYNAVFDCKHLPELQMYNWYDIMRLAAYKQFNSKIPPDAELYSTGKLKSGYGVENIYRMLSGNNKYCEMHNALQDAADELEIMRMLDLKTERY